MITSFTPKKSFCFFWGRSLGVSVTSITVTTVSLLDLVELFFLLNGSFPIVKAFFPSYLQSDL
jgi:hypothetical protein